MMTDFSFVELSGKDSSKFLQGQLTINVAKLTPAPMACAIANLKGRVQFGLWVSQVDSQTYQLIVASDCMDELVAHLKKYGAFSKISIGEPVPIYTCVVQGVPTFTTDKDKSDHLAWQQASIEQGNYWLTKATQGLFQPQELRLHQRGGVDYDKGCYLGQEVIARLYFKASPKAWLHRVAITPDNIPHEPKAGEKLDKVQVVNAIFDHEHIMQALVIGAPNAVAQIGEVLPLPDKLNGDVGRQQ